MCVQAARSSSSSSSCASKLSQDIRAKIDDVHEKGIKQIEEVLFTHPPGHGITDKQVKYILYAAALQVEGLLKQEKELKALLPIP